MKTIHKLITALLLLITLEGFGQYVSIPDTSFGAWLNASNFCTTGSSATGWYLDTTCTTVTTQTHILITAGYSMQDLNGLQYFKSLQTLIIWNNPINSLPVLSGSLRSVYIYNNQFTSLPILPDSVTTLVFNGNPLTSIPHLPLHLRELHLTNDMLYSLPALPASIDTFYCDQNYLSSLPTLPDSLTYIDCSYNALTSLPTLPANLRTLACVYNNLTTLPALPASIYAVDLTSNRLVSLPALPASLHALDVPYNQISDLPALPAQLRILLCDSNKLTYLPALPDTLDALSITYNAGIRCLPTLHFFGSSPNIADGTNISCVPNYGSGNSQIFLSYPLCTSGNCSGAGGADLIVCEYDNVTMNAHGAGSWRAMSGNPSLPTIVNPTDPNTIITNFTAAGVYSFIWTSVAGADTVAVTVTAKPNAGVDQTICQYNSVIMAAVGIGSWSTPNGNPSATNIVTPSSPTSLITGFDQPGAYSFIWTSNGCTDTAVVLVTAKPNAGIDETIWQRSTAVMNASGVGVWTALGNNPAVTTITSITAQNTTISGFMATGNYGFVWTSNGCTDTVSVDVVSDAGPDQTTCLNNTIAMAAYGSGTWTQLSSNPLPVSFSDTTAYNATVTGFTLSGTYSFVWATSGGSDTMHVIVHSPPTANAGINQLYCLPAGIITIGGTPTVSGGSGNYSYAWSPVLGLSSATVADPTISSPVAGTTTYTVTVTDNVSNCSATSAMTLTINSTPSVSIVVSPDSNITIGQNAILQGVGVPSGGTYQWSPTVAMNPASGNAPTEQVTPATTQTYCVTYTLNGCNISSCQGIHVFSASAGRDDTICQNGTVTMAAIGSGAWTQLLSNPVHVNFSDTTAHNSTVTGFTQSGTYSFVWTTAGGSDTMNVVVVSGLNSGFMVSDTITCTTNPSPLNPIIYTDTTVGGIHHSWSFTAALIASNPNPGDVASFSTQFASQGYGTIRLIVSDALGACHDTAYRNIHVANPIADYTLPNLSDTFKACPPLTINPFIDSSINDIAFYRWYFGDGSPYDTNRNVPHIYTLAGVHPVTHIVTSRHGCIDTVTKYVIKVGGPYISDTIFNVSCFGASDGEVDISVAGGIRPYTYAWLPSISNTNQITNLIPGTYCVTVTDSTGCIASDCFAITQPTLLSVMDSVHNVSCPGGNDGGICAFASGGLIPYTWLWSNTNTTSCAGVPGFGLVAGNYCVTVVDANGCAAYLCDTISTGHDCIWPGDADANNLVDNNDLLPIGLGYDSTGTARSSVSIVWQADAATDWSQSFGSYTPVVNYKHADCNGDGTIDAVDTTAILQNFGLTHAKNNGGPGPWRSGITGIRAIFSADSLYNGDTLTVTFVLGDTLTQVSNLYGLAFTYNFDPAVVDSTIFSGIDFGNSWLGGSADKISISKTLYTAGQIKTAVTRIDHTNRSGYGAFATAKFKITTDNISGKDLAYYSFIGFISDVRAIDEHGTLLTLNAGADTAQVGYTPTGIKEINTEKVYLYPNPAHDQVTIQADHPITDVSISNIAGQVVCHKLVNNIRSYTLDVSALDEGLYFVEIKTASSTGIAKLSVVK